MEKDERYKSERNSGIHARDIKMRRIMVFNSKMVSVRDQSCILSSPREHFDDTLPLSGRPTTWNWLNDNYMYTVFRLGATYSQEIGIRWRRRQSVPRNYLQNSSVIFQIVVYSLEQEVSESAEYHNDAIFSVAQTAQFLDLVTFLFCRVSYQSS